MLPCATARIVDRATCAPYDDGHLCVPVVRPSRSPQPSTGHRGGPLNLPGEVRFPSGSGECTGDLYLPEGASANSPEGTSGESKVPVVILAHGIASERSFGLAPFARRFADSGVAALVFDYRNFGGSPGEPRGLVAPSRQVEDYLAAMAFARTHPQLDGTRMALWGTSFSGGHVLAAAATRPDGLRAVVSQIPFVSGLASTMTYPLRYHLPAIVLGVLDRVRARLGLSRLRVEVVRDRGLALLASPDSHSGYLALVPPGVEGPRPVPAGVFLSVLTYHPGRLAGQVEVPSLLLVAAEDAICPASAARRTARRMRDVRLEEFPIGHFDAYHGDWFEELVEREARFLERHLLERPLVERNATPHGSLGP